jgi:hypothetical protein
MKMTRHIMAFTLLLSGAATAQEGAWIADTSVGCQVWNPHPQPNETIWWSGACANGLAQGRGVSACEPSRNRGNEITQHAQAA